MHLYTVHGDFKRRATNKGLSCYWYVVAATEYTFLKLWKPRSEHGCRECSANFEWLAHMGSMPADWTCHSVAEFGDHAQRVLPPCSTMHLVPTVGN